MEENNSSAGSRTAEKRFGCLQVLGLWVLAVIITAGISVLVVKTYFFPSAFKPVILSPGEEIVLNDKLKNLDSIGTDVVSHKNVISNTSPPQSNRLDPNAVLEPEPYSEKNSPREIRFTERELNALLAKNTDLAKKLAIDLSDDLISAKVLLPVDEDFPILGGKILRVRTGVVLTYKKGKPVVILKGVTIMGVPIPNAWLGGIKNIDLVEKFGGNPGFWRTFSDGVEDIKVEEGLLTIKLKV